MATPRQIEANRRNAQKSTGPRTAEGKDRSRFNGVTHGMTAKFDVLPGEDGAALTGRIDAWTADFQPRTSSSETWSSGLPGFLGNSRGWSEPMWTG